MFKKINIDCVSSSAAKARDPQWIDTLVPLSCTGILPLRIYISKNQPFGSSGKDIDSDGTFATATFTVARTIGGCSGEAQTAPPRMFHVGQYWKTSMPANAAHLESGHVHYGIDQRQFQRGYVLHSDAPPEQATAGPVRHDRLNRPLDRFVRCRTPFVRRPGQRLASTCCSRCSNILKRLEAAGLDRRAESAQRVGSVASPGFVVFAQATFG